jgi:hypothetical protein
VYKNILNARYAFYNPVELQRNVNKTILRLRLCLAFYRCCGAKSFDGLSELTGYPASSRTKNGFIGEIRRSWISRQWARDAWTEAKTALNGIPQMAICTNSIIKDESLV